MFWGSGNTQRTKPRGEGDSRSMAVQALRFIGADRFARRPDIVRQLRALAADQKLNKELREDYQEQKREKRLRNLGEKAQQAEERRSKFID